MNRTYNLTNPRNRILLMAI